MSNNRTREEIRHAISVLTAVSKSDLASAGLEAEFSVAYLAFVESYERHIARQTAKDNAGLWACSQMRACPKCGGRDLEIRSPIVNASTIYTHLQKDADAVFIETDIYDNHYYKSYHPVFLSLVEEKLPEWSFLLKDHLWCNDCQLPYDSEDTMSKKIWEAIPVKEIVAWTRLRDKPPAKE